MPRTYKIRRFVNGASKGGKEFTNYSLTVPSNIASQLSPDLLFECVLTKEGILFRPSSATDENAIELPAWALAAAEEEPEPEEVAPARSRKRAAQQAA